MPIFPGSPESSLALPAGPWTHRTVRANGIGLHVAEQGTGPLVLLLHGFPQYWWAWRDQLDALATAGFHAVAVDLRGYGASDKPPRGYDIPTLAKDVSGLVTALGERDAMLVGNDVGGLIAWTMAATAPKVVRSLVALGAPHPLRLRAALAEDSSQRRAWAPVLRTFQVPRRPEHLIGRDGTWTRELYARWSGPRWRSNPEFNDVARQYTDAMRIHPVGYCAAEYFRWMIRSVPRSDGRRYVTSMQTLIQAPVLHLQGALDTCLLPTTARGSDLYVTGEYEWQELDGVGHYPHDEVSGRISADLVRWAKQTAS